MKTPFIKVRGLGLYRDNNKRDRQAIQRSLAQSQLDELSQASQDMIEMRDCYDSLLSAAAGTTNNAYEFSESLQEMGDCLLAKTALSDDEDSGRVLLMLGKVQFDIQKLIDNYRSHISQTITVPSESLLNELRVVEDMKKQCDEKRMAYEVMKTQHEKGRSKNSKGEYVSSRQLQSARDEFDEDATLFILRMKSLKNGQSRSLLTQAARHHAAQMCFFRKALKSLEAIEPHVKSITEQQHIDYHFSGLEDDDRDSVFLTDDDENDEDESDDYCDGREDGRNVQKNEVSSSRNSMELDNKDITFSRVGSVNSGQANSYRKTSLNTGSKSAPLSADATFDRNERYRPRKLSTYVLPTPLEKKNSAPSRTGTQHPQQIPPTNTNIWHSMPLEQITYENTFRKEKNPRPIVSSNNIKPTAAAEADSGSASTSTSKKIKRDRFSGPMMGNVKRGAFSGPLIGGFQSKKPLLSTSGSIGSATNHMPFSGPLFCTPLTQPSDVIASSGPLPTIRELHELPRPPPANMASKKTSKVGFSAPLVMYRGDIDDTAKAAAYTLPLPTSKSQRESWKLGGDEAKVSPPLSPISF